MCLAGLTYKFQCQNRAGPATTPRGALFVVMTAAGLHTGMTHKAYLLNNYLSLSN